MSTGYCDIDLTKQWRAIQFSYMAAYILDKLREKPDFDEEYTQLLNQAEYERNKVAEALIDAKQNSPFVK